MRLFESIIDANHRAVAGDANAGLRPVDFAEELPVIALTCIDPRLNAYFPNALALPAEEFIWLRNAGNIITGPLSSTMRSLALACAVKGGREIAIIGHTDCQVAKTTTMQLLDKLKALGIERHLLPDNLNDFFGMFASERQNVIKAVDIIRHSPLIGPKIPVHGLLLDIETGKLDWLVNGYENWQTSLTPGVTAKIGPLGHLADFNLGEMKFPEAKIGELATKTEDWLSKEAEKIGATAQEQMRAIAPAVESAETTAKQVVEYAEKHWPQSPPKLPMPPPIRPRLNVRRR
jgi:carbonic anhydrase